MAKYKSKPSKNVQDLRSIRANDIYSKAQVTPFGKMKAASNQLGANGTLGVSQQARKNASALGLSDSLSGLQNTANTMQARKRSRMLSVYKSMMSGK